MFVHVGDILKVRDVLRTQPLFIKPVLDGMLEQVPGDTGNFMREVHATVDSDEPTFKFAETVAGHIDHTIETINQQTMQQLYTAVMADLWRTVGECCVAAVRYKEWGESAEPLLTAQLSVHALAADGAQQDEAYWRGRLVRAIGVRTMMCEQVVEKLSEFAARLHSQKAAMASILQMVSEIGAAVNSPPPPSDVPPELN